MINGQNPNRLVLDCVSDDEGCVRNRELPSSGDAATASRRGMLAEHLGNINDMLRNFFCCPRVRIGNVLVDVFQLFRGGHSPSDIHLTARRERANFEILARTSEVSMVRPSFTALSPSLIKLW